MKNDHRGDCGPTVPPSLHNTPESDFVNFLVAAMCKPSVKGTEGVPVKSVRRRIIPDARVITSDEYLKELENREKEIQKKKLPKGRGKKRQLEENEEDVEDEGLATITHISSDSESEDDLMRERSEVNEERCQARKRIDNYYAEIQENIAVNNYYAVYFDKKYYVGRVIEINNDDVILKFLYNKPNTSQFDWPVRDDISSVSENNFSWPHGY